MESCRYFVYMHISPSQKVYVGITKDIKKRWGYKGEHYTWKQKNGEYMHKPFALAILKYGWENFQHTIVLENVSKSEAIYAEKYLIRWYKIHNLSYNITDGGDGVLGHSHPISAERREAISIFMRTNHPMKGKKHSEASRTTGIDASCIRRCCDPQCRLFSAGKFKWEYDNGENRKDIAA